MQRIVLYADLLGFRNQVKALALQDVVHSLKSVLYAVCAGAVRYAASLRVDDIVSSLPTLDWDDHSIVYADHTLWIAGDEGTVLNSKDLGLTWSVSHLRDGNGDLPTLLRVMAFGHSLWIVGYRVVYSRNRSVERQ